MADPEGPDVNSTVLRRALGKLDNRRSLHQHEMSTKKLPYNLVVVKRGGPTKATEYLRVSVIRSLAHKWVPDITQVELDRVSMLPASLKPPKRGV
jgi:hypothetical protein